MKIQIIHAGDFKEPYFQSAFQEYIKRLSAFVQIKDILIKERPIIESSQIEKALFEEGRDILSKIDSHTYAVALCVEGKQITSEEFACFFEKCAIMSYSTIAFIIGSSYGLSPDVKARANMKLSFSKMTFPHQLMRVILSEQIYRAFSIMNGSKYHK